jgi:hypothetical protein
VGLLRRGALVGKRAVGRGVFPGIRMNSEQRKSTWSEDLAAPAQFTSPPCLPPDYEGNDVPCVPPTLKIGCLLQHHGAAWGHPGPIE